MVKKGNNIKNWKSLSEECKSMKITFKRMSTLPTPQRKSTTSVYQ